GGLLIRGTPAERERAVARALELGINYFDTAPIYGDGQSETNLGQVIRALKPRLYVGTKFRVPDVPAAELPAAVARSLEDSPERGPRPAAAVSRAGLRPASRPRCQEPRRSDRDPRARGGCAERDGGAASDRSADRGPDRLRAGVRGGRTPRAHAGGAGGGWPR